MLLFFFFLNLGVYILGNNFYFWMVIIEVCLILVGYFLSILVGFYIGGYLILISVLVLFFMLYLLNVVFFNFVLSLKEKR